MATHHREINEEDYNQLLEGKTAFVDAYDSDEYNESDMIVFYTFTVDGKRLASKHNIIQVLGNNNTKAIKKNHIIAFVGEASK